MQNSYKGETMKSFLINKSNQFFLAVVVSLLLISSAGAAPHEKIEADTRCPVCGMFVAKYDVWITQIRYDDSHVFIFDGVKDLMAYYQNPAAYNGQERSKISEIWVKDYYSLKWQDARKAFFVIGSDIHGPMGHELIPFASKTAAESFRVDHHGQQVLTFDEITEEMVDMLRAGNHMKHMSK
jgi:copper chaperone NosL